MYSNQLLLHIASPTRVTINSEILIDNIFSNIYVSSFISENVVTTMFDNHAQFLLIKFQTKRMTNENIHIFREFSKIEKK